MKDHSWHPVTDGCFIQVPIYGGSTSVEKTKADLGPPWNFFKFFLLQLCITGVNISNTIIIVYKYFIYPIFQIRLLLQYCIFIQYLYNTTTPPPLFKFSNPCQNFSSPFVPPLTSNPGSTPETGKFCQNTHKLPNHDDAIKWKYFQHYWSFVWRIHRSPVNLPHKGQRCRALIFS